MGYTKCDWCGFYFEGFGFTEYFEDKTSCYGVRKES